ncbi:hypothetical protein KIN20_019381 [Parelaphostrongylus tenuis]|uniref:Secreted protein n=1 Tax=Parelaphostrongylus tenuis TaxID=148309 RepID=A0AAD5N8N7_PARTN|nr:hypothetical protein KIN20_019381 [Parelaphostrongylus tenuis]
MLLVAGVVVRITGLLSIVVDSVTFKSEPIVLPKEEAGVEVIACSTIVDDLASEIGDAPKNSRDPPNGVTLIAILTILAND